MNTNKRIKRSIAAGIIVLFFLIGIIPCTEAGNIIMEKDKSLEKTSEEITMEPKTLDLLNPPTYYIIGTMGENNWYISCVNVTFSYNHEQVDEIWYRIDVGGTWQKYQDKAIVICKDGPHYILWYWIDGVGQHNETSLFFRIDQTPPDTKLSKKTSIQGEVTFTATVTDEASGVKYVEFYFDDVLQVTLDKAPYKWVWTGEGAHMVYVISYNYAGLSVKSNSISTPRSLSYYPNFLNIVFQKIYNIIIWIQQSI
jgi:hypothetical protein